MTPRTLLFANTAALGMPGLILLAVAIVAFIAWLVVGTRAPEFGDHLSWFGAGLIGVVLIAYLGSWHEVTIDAASRRVTERFGYLGFGFGAGKKWDFPEFTTVLVERTTGTEHAAASSPGSHGASTRVKSSAAHRYTLSLRGDGRQLDLPMATRDDVFFRLRAKPQGAGERLPPMATANDVLALEAAARQLARLGGWAASRRGYEHIAGDIQISAGAQGAIDGE